MQTVLVYLIVAIAAIYIGRRAYKALMHKNHAGCEHCSPSGMEAKSKKTVPDK